MPKFRNDCEADSNPGPLDCESGVLLLSYHAPRVIVHDDQLKYLLLLLPWNLPVTVIHRVIHLQDCVKGN